MIVGRIHVRVEARGVYVNYISNLDPAGRLKVCQGIASQPYFQPSLRDWCTCTMSNPGLAFCASSAVPAGLTSQSLGLTHSL